MNPLEKFKDWYNEETQKSTVRIPSACCLSSIGIDGFPNARMVSLKEVREEKFVVTGPMNSKKGKELLANPKASLIIWWTDTERQIRVQGEAFQIEDELADHYFKDRNKESQIVIAISSQGAEIDDITELMTLFKQRKAECTNTEIERPKDWSGFYIVPKRIEFMEFNKNRFHYRELFTRNNNKWYKVMLQP